MTQEEKAKRYDEALEELRGLLEGIREEKCKILEEDIISIFPELQENEDEKIRKGIIRNLEYLMDSAEGFVKDELKERIVWLEQQGKQSKQKFAEWSKEDEAITLQIEQIMKCASFLNIVPGKLNKINKLLKSLKQRIKE